MVVEESVDDELDDDVGDDGHDTVDDVDDGHVTVDDADGSDGTSFDWEEMLRHPEPEVVAGFACGLDNFDALQKAATELCTIRQRVVARISNCCVQCLNF